MIAYRYEDETLEYKGRTQQAYLDPEMTKVRQTEIYACPGHCTFKNPLTNKEGYAVVFDKELDNWKYVVDYRNKRAYNDEGLTIITYLGDLQGSDKLLTDAQIEGLDNGTLIWQNGEIIPKPEPTIEEQIQELEKQIEELNTKMLRDIIILQDENASEEEKTQAQTYFNNKLAQKQELVDRINELKNS